MRAHHGPALTDAAACHLFHERLRPPGERQGPERAKPVGSTAPARLRAPVRLMAVQLENPMPIPRVAAEAGLSQRQLEWSFSSHAEFSPVRDYAGLGLDHGRGLVAETEMPLWRVARACGSASTEHLSRSYRGRFGLSPRRDRVEGRVPFELRAAPMRRRSGRP